MFNIGAPRLKGDFIIGLNLDGIFIVKELFSDKHLNSIYWKKKKIDLPIFQELLGPRLSLSSGPQESSYATARTTVESCSLSACM